ncbi:MAG TPA: TadE/TadG family type IV pilus assembly protein [Roseiflexaceae bacterium]|mgnify:CR=1 FL=1|nr:TadE/TadG family type IV pilus assembly protein [Roseiflexaceae bacterium]HMP39353.1 TadE/TadG family type IV pilus assembly protein [Roseiflexaceae bacterium]
MRNRRTVESQETRPQAQSLVELALLLPLLLTLLFGIIDMGWYIYNYTTVWRAARDGAEAAAQVPPTVELLAMRRGDGTAAWSDNLPAQLPDYPEAGTDPCVCAILREIGVADHACGAETRDQNVLVDIFTNQVTIGYPPVLVGGTPRELGKPIEVTIDTSVEPLTPLVNFVGTALGNNGVMRIQATAQRSIESLGNNPNYANGLACRIP